MPGEPTPLFTTKPLDEHIPYITLLDTDYPLKNNGRVGIRKSRHIFKIAANMQRTNYLDASVPDEQAEAALDELFTLIKEVVDVPDEVLDSLEFDEAYGLATVLANKITDFTRRGKNDGEADAPTEPTNTNGQDSQTPLSLVTTSQDTDTTNG